MNINNKNKWFGRSGAFKRKKKILVNEIINNQQRRRPITSITRRNNENTVSISEKQIAEKDICEPLTVDRIDNTNNENQMGDIICEQHESNDELNNKAIGIIDEDEINNDSNVVFNKTKFQSALAQWAVDNNVTHIQLRGLLRIWNKHVPLPPLPSDPRTILETPKNITIKNDYWHRGLICALISMLKKINHMYRITYCH